MSEECHKTFSPSETVIQVVRQVNPGHANPLGIMHGGYMLEWIIDVSTLQAMRVARSYTVVACMEDMVFVAPVRVGSLVAITSWVEYIGKSSVEVSMLVETEEPLSGARSITTYSSLTMVAVDDKLKPKPVGACIKPRGDYEKELVEAAIKRREERKPRISERKLKVSQADPPKPLIEEYYIKSYKIVNPEDTISHSVLHAGKLMRTLDEIAGIVAAKYTGGITVTGAVDSTDFYTPIYVGDIVETHAALTYVGSKSLEITVKVLARNPLTWEARHATTSYYTFVHIGKNGRTMPIKEFKPVEEWQKNMYIEARARKERRTTIVNKLRSKEFLDKIERIREKITKSKA